MTPSQSPQEQIGGTEGVSAEEQMERRVDFIIRELDEIVGMANNSETVDLVENESIGIGQIRFRAELALSFLDARKSPKFKVVR
jgi:hypothetical protein